MPAVADRPKKGKKKQGSPTYVPNEHALARAIGYSDRSTIQKMREHPEAPKKSKRGYYVPAWKKFDEQVWRPSRQKNAKIEDATEMAKARLRKVELDNEARELKLKKERGELVSLDEVNTVITEAFVGMVHELNRQANEAAPDLAGLDTLEAMELLKEKNRAVLENFALGEWAKKKAFWDRVYAKFQDLQATYNLGSGESATSSTAA